MFPYRFAVHVLCIFVCCAIMFQVAQAAKLTTFGTAIKGHSICPCQTCVDKRCWNCSKNWTGHGCQDAVDYQAILYNFSTDSYSPLAPSSQPNTIRMVWFTGDLLWPHFGNVTIRIYIDGEKEASIAFKLFEAHALGFGWDQAESRTWGIRQFGKGALNGGLYMTFQIPFLRKFLITAELPTQDFLPNPKSHGLYFIGRGLMGAPVVMPTLPQPFAEFPAHTRLKLYKIETVVAPHATLVIAQCSNCSGMVYLVTMRAQSAGNHFLEGEFKATLDGQPITLSSGTEDYFLSAQYFDAGEFQFPNSGCNHLDFACLLGDGPCRVVAYRFHEADPIFFSSSFSLTWEAGDPFWKVYDTNVVFYVWVYQY